MNLFEFDESKNLSNQAKHGISFEEAKALWQDPQLLEIPARTEGEPRFLIVARYRLVHWSAVITYRGTVIRLISVRRSRNEEMALYENLDL